MVWAIRTAVIQGVRRACFSNEAGLGSAPIAHATAKTDEPIREGVVAAMGPMIDTIIICTMTALVILITSSLTRDSIGTISNISDVQVVQKEGGDVLVYRADFSLTDEKFKKVGEEFFAHKAPKEKDAPGETIKLRIREITTEGPNMGKIFVGNDTEFKNDEDGQKAINEEIAVLKSNKDIYLFREGVDLTAFAFDRGIPGFGTYFIPIAVVLFAFSTIVSWGYYGETAVEYLFGFKAVLPFKFLYVIMIIVGTLSMNLKPVLDFSDAMLGLMLVPNLIGTVMLAPRVFRAKKDYFRRLKAGEFEEDARRIKAAKRHAGEDI